jgi:esterase
MVGDQRTVNWVYVLHGIFGAGRNWASFARKLVEARPEWGVVLVDLRQHGRSRGFKPPHTLEACAQDLLELAEFVQHPPRVILGHSFGGKVALMATRVLPPSQVWVIDSSPSRRTPSGGAYQMLEILKRLPGPFRDRGEVVESLQAEGVAEHVAHWMATNLEVDVSGYYWCFDLADIESMMSDFFRQDLWDIVEDPHQDSEIHLVRATRSDVVPVEDLERFDRVNRNRRIFGHEVSGGHWLHVDNPDGLHILLQDRLPRV